MATTVGILQNIWDKEHEVHKFRAQQTAAFGVQIKKLTDILQQESDDEAELVQRWNQEDEESRDEEGEIIEDDENFDEDEKNVLPWDVAGTVAASEWKPVKNLLRK